MFQKNINFFIQSLFLISTFFNFSYQSAEVIFKEKGNYSKEFKTLSCEEICPLTEEFFNRKCSINLKTWREVCPMTAELEQIEELEKMEKPLNIEHLNNYEIKIKFELISKKTEELIQKNEKLIDEHIIINSKNKQNFDENGIIRIKSNKFWNILKSKEKEKEVEEFDGPIYRVKNKNILPKCKGWEKLKIQFWAYWSLTKEVWNEFKKIPLDPQAEIFYYNEKKIEEFRKEGLKFFNLICERDFISKKRCKLIDENKVEKPKDFSKVLNLFVKFILKTLIAKKVYSPLDISDETLALLKAILTRKDFLHPSLSQETTKKSSKGINQMFRNKRMIGITAVLSVLSIATKITIITFASAGAIIGLVMIAAVVHFCVH